MTKATAAPIPLRPAPPFAEPAAGFAMPAPVHAHDDASSYIGSLIGHELHTIVSKQHTAWVGVDPDGVHQMRAAGRRLRCHIRHYRKLLDPDWVEVTMQELRWFGTTLGEVRDLEVMRDVLSACAASLTTTDLQNLEPLFASVSNERNGAREVLRSALEGERYGALLSALATAAAEPPVVVDTDADAESLARTTAARAMRRLDHAVANLGPTPSDSDLHRVRLLAKRARFAAEAAIPLVGTPARKLAKAMANVQIVLGTQHDAVVAHQWVRTRALQEDAAVSFSAGMVAGLLRNASQQAAREFPEVWRKASRTKLRAWL